MEAAYREDDLLDKSHTVELPVEELSQLYSFCPGIFGRIVIDEAQKIKISSTQTQLSISALNILTHCLLTATPKINRPIDLKGIMTLFWKPRFDSIPLPKSYLSRAPAEEDDEAEDTRQ